MARFVRIRDPWAWSPEVVHREVWRERPLEVEGQAIDYPGAPPSGGRAVQVLRVRDVDVSFEGLYHRRGQILEACPGGDEALRGIAEVVPGCVLSESAFDADPGCLWFSEVAPCLAVRRRPLLYDEVARLGPLVVPGRRRVSAHAALVPLLVNYGLNYFHATARSFPMAVAVARAVDDVDAEWLIYDTPAMRGLLTLLGVPRSRWVLYDPNTLYRADRAYLVWGLNPACDAPAPETVRTVAAALAPVDRRIGDVALVVSRGDAIRRRFCDDDAIAEIVAGVFPDLPVEVRVLSALDLQAQIACFRRARVVVGVHGAGLANVVHCRPGTGVVEVVPGRDDVRFGVFGANDLTWFLYLSLCTPGVRYSPLVVDASWDDAEIDVDAHHLAHRLRAVAQRRAASSASTSRHSGDPDAR